MTESEKQALRDEILASIRTNSVTIEGLTPVSTLSDSDYFEVSGGRKIKYTDLADMIVAMAEGQQGTLQQAIERCQLSNVTFTATESTATLSIRTVGGHTITTNIPVATDTKAGLLTPIDKQKIQTAYDTALFARDKANAADSKADTAGATATRVEGALADLTGTIGQANGLAQLEADGLIPTSNLPEFVRNASMCVGTTTLAEIDAPTIDCANSRIVRVMGAFGVCGWLMYLACRNYVTQIFFTHQIIDGDGVLITNSHDEQGVHVYKRVMTLSNHQWTRWQEIGGDGLVAAIGDIEGRLTAEEQIATERHQELNVGLMMTQTDVDRLKIRYKEYSLPYGGNVNIDANQIMAASCAGNPVIFYNVPTRTFVAKVPHDTQYFSNWPAALAYGSESIEGARPWAGNIYYNSEDTKLYTVGAGMSLVRLVQDNDIEPLIESTHQIQEELSNQQALFEEVIAEDIIPLNCMSATSLSEALTEHFDNSTDAYSTIASAFIPGVLASWFDRNLTVHYARYIGNLTSEADVVKNVENWEADCQPLTTRKPIGMQGLEYSVHANSEDIFGLTERMRGLATIDALGETNALINGQPNESPTEMYDEFDADIRERGIIPSLINMSEKAQGLNAVLENTMERLDNHDGTFMTHAFQIQELSRQMQSGDMLSFDGVVEGHVDVNQASLGSGSYRVLYSTTRCAFIVESGGNYYNNWTESYLYGKGTVNGVIPWRGRVFYNQANGSLCAVIGGQMIGFRMGENAVEISESLLSVENAHGGIRLTQNGTIQTRLGATGQWRRLPTLVCHGLIGIGNLTTTETTLSISHFTTYNGDMPSVVKLSTGKARFYLPATWNELSLRYENTIRRVTPTAGRCSAQMSNISTEGSRSYFDITTYYGDNLDDMTVEIELWLCE